MSQVPGANRAGYARLWPSLRTHRVTLHGRIRRHGRDGDRNNDHIEARRLQSINKVRQNAISDLSRMIEASEVFTFGPDQARRNVVEGAPTAYASAIHIRE